MIRYREGIDVLDMLKRCGFSSYELRKQKIFGQAAIDKLRKGGLPLWNQLNFICQITSYPIGEIIEYVPDENDIIGYQKIT